MKSKNVVYSVNLLLCALMLFGAISCKKDKKEEECVPPALATQIVGDWKASVASVATLDIGFTQSGEITGGLAAVIKNINPVLENMDDLIKYEVKSDTQVDVLATQSGASLPVFSLTVAERDCEKIVLSGTGFSITLTK